MKIVIREVVVRDTQLVSKSGGVVQEQVAELVIPGRVVPLELRLRVGPKGPVAVGEYAIDPDSFQQGKYGRVDFYARVGARLEVGALSAPKARVA